MSYPVDPDLWDHRVMTPATRAAVVLAVLLCACVAAVGLLLSRPPGRAGPGARPAASLAPPTGALLGAWVTPPGDFTDVGRRDAIARLEADLGRRLDIDHHFYAWDKPFPTADERWDLRQGRIPMISWGDADTVAVASGAEDALIRSRADAVRALGSPVLLRWFWEMDGSRYAQVAHSPEHYVAAWRHLHDVFAERGADNARWVWCPNASGFADNSAPRYWPGGAYVDWVCADGYDYPWTDQSFAQVFAAFHRWGATTGKPLMVGEFGAVEGSPGDKAQWLRDARAALKERLPRIAAIVYFDATRRYDWRVDSTPASFQAFRTLATDPYFDRRSG
jgi:Glycosyl hydrolase family 26